MSFIVLKFGGSSLTSRGYKKILEQVNFLKEKYKVIVVLSAVQNTTNNLLDYIHNDRDRIFEVAQKHYALMEELEVNIPSVNIMIDALKDLDTYNMDLEGRIKTISAGEYLSTRILSGVLEKEGIKHKLLNSREYIYSDSSFDDINSISFATKGSFWCDEEKLLKQMKNDNIFIMQGFIATTRDSHPCLLSRGGSDTTASLIASSLNAKRLEIWTDVNGVFTSDPRKVSGTKIINHIGYDLCQELAAMGAKVMHPYSIKPCQKKKIPIYVKNTYGINKKGRNTIIGSRYEIEGDGVVAITNQGGVTTYDIRSLDMWNNYGFLHDIFGTFSSFQIDINIIITSQFSVRVTTDEVNVGKIYNVAKELDNKYQVKITRNSSIVSIVGYNITENPKVQNTLELVKKLGSDNIHIIHYASNNLTLSYVVNSSVAGELTQILHDNLIEREEVRDGYENKWWYKEREQLLRSVGTSSGVYMYNLEEVRKRCNKLKENLRNVSELYYAMKANSNREVLNEVINNGFGIECVSLSEVNYVRENFGDNVKILFTPNYCEVWEYEGAFIKGAQVVVDNVEVIMSAMEIFRGREIGLRLDCDLGDGHHEKVVTEGDNVKFGYPIGDVETFMNMIDGLDIKVVGLHSHKGSGILDNYSWRKTARRLMSIKDSLPDLRWINLGGGLGVRTRNRELDLEKVNDSLKEFGRSGLKLWMEPGRFIVSEAGVLLARVTQVRRKGNKNFLGISTGMNSLIRPTLYNAYHGIYNLTRVEEKANVSYSVVGPICETGDKMGENRLLPRAKVEDIILIENGGAYGYVMSSNYNMREPASEVILQLEK